MWYVRTHRFLKLFSRLEAYKENSTISEMLGDFSAMKTLTGPDWLRAVQVKVPQKLHMGWWNFKQKKLIRISS